MTEINVPILIVGGGPVGLLGAQLLGRQGLKVLLVEKYPTRLEAPKAHALNPRSLEICAAAGLSMDAIHAVATPTEEGRYVRFVETLSKPDIGVMAYERQDEAVREVTPWPLINIEQPRFEAVLEAAVANQPTVEVRKGMVWSWLLTARRPFGLDLESPRDRPRGHRPPPLPHRRRRGWQSCAR